MNLFFVGFADGVSGMFPELGWGGRCWGGWGSSYFAVVSVVKERFPFGARGLGTRGAQVGDVGFGSLGTRDFSGFLGLFVGFPGVR